MTWRPVLVLVGGFLLGAVVVGRIVYGAFLHDPKAPPVPAGATVIATDQGWDDDDPNRSRVQVADAAGSSVEDVLKFYRDVFPQSDGWRPVRVEDPRELCLVNRTNDDYTQVLDISR